MQNKGNLGDEYSLYNLSTEDCITNLDDIFCVYKYVYEIPDTEQFRLKKLLATSLNAIAKLIEEYSIIKNLYASIFQLFSTTRELNRFFPCAQQLTKIHQEAVSITLKFQEIINTVTTWQNTLANERAQIILHLMPALEVFMHIMQKLPQTISHIDRSYACKFNQILEDLDNISELLRNNYRLLQQQRLTPQGKKSFWLKFWDKIHDTLYSHNSCAPLEEVKSLSNYWYFLIDDKYAIKVVKASMPKFAHLADEPEELSKQTYQTNISDEIEFNQLTNHVVYGTNQEFEFLERVEINAYIARDNTPEKLLEILAEMLIDSDLDLINIRLHANQIALREAKDALQNISTNSITSDLQILKNAMHFNYEISNACMENLLRILTSQSIDIRNLLLIEAITNNKAMWVGILLKNDASLSATDAEGDDVLLISLKTSRNTRGKVLDKLLTLSEEQLLKIPNLRSDTVANFVDKETGNTLLHEIALRKKPAYAFFQFYCQLDLNRPFSYIFFLKNNKQELIVDLVKDIKLKQLLQQYLNLLFYQGLYSNNLRIVNLYLNSGGDTNAVLNGEHPLVIVWKNLRENDENVIDILFALLQKGIDVNTPVHNGMSIYNATCQTLSARSLRHRFLIDNQDNYKDALCVLTEFRQQNKNKKLLAALKDSLVLNWLTCNIQLDVQDISKKCTSLLFCELLFHGEINKSGLFFITILLAVSILNSLSPTEQTDQAHEPPNNLKGAIVKYRPGLLSNELTCV